MQDYLAFEKLDIQEDEVLIIRSNLAPQELDYIDKKLTQHLENKGLTNVVAIHLGPGDSVRNIDEHTMLLHGFLRITEEVLEKNWFKQWFGEGHKRCLPGKRWRHSFGQKE